MFELELELAKEPAATSGISVGLLTLLTGPLQDLLLEMGASERLASAVVKLLLLTLPVAAALYTRSRTVTKIEHNAVVNEALTLPPRATRADLRRSMEKKAGAVAQANKE